MMKATLFVVTAAILATGSANAVAQGKQSPPFHCVISMIDHVQLPAEEEGILRELNAKEGMLVTQGQELGRLDVTDTLVRQKAAEARLAIAREKSTNETEVLVAKKLVELYKAEYDQSLAINQKSPGTIPETELRRQRVTWEKYVLDALVADMNFKVSGFELEEAEAQVEAVQNELSRRIIKAPFDGVIARLFRQQDEWVRAGEPILYVVRMDRLRIEAFINADRYSPEQVEGADVQVVLDLVGDREHTIPAKISYVSPVIEASGIYRIWAEVDNPPGNGYRWLMRPGAEAEMIVTLKQ